MRRVILFRHGKSDWEAGAAGDHERPLAPRGVEAAGTMGRLLASVGAVPDLVISSSAVRARTTAELAMKAGNWSCPLQVTEALYGASPGMVIDLIQSQPADIESLLLVGHEPTWSTLAGLLTGGSSLRMVTAAMAAIDFAVPGWGHVGVGSGQLVWMLPPRLFTDGSLRPA